MKKVIFLSAVLFALASCNNDSSTAKTEASDSTSKMSSDSMNYPYALKNPDGWLPGDKQHTMDALKALKAFETGNIDECVTYFADSVRLRFDEMDKKVSKDSLTALFKKWRGEDKSVTINMHDWESVKNKFSNEEYVSVWYDQAWETNAGKKDSVSVMDDLKFEKGKIVELDEKTRKFPKSK